MSINTAMISGNLTRDSELRTTPTGTSVLNFSVAVNDRRKDSSGEWKDYPNYFDCVLFGRRAESLAVYLLKGTKVAVQGKLHQSSWQDGNGKNRSKVDITVDQVEFMSRKEKSSQSDDPYSQPMMPRNEAQNDGQIDAFSDADITF